MVTLPELKAHLRVEQDEEDATLAMLLSVAKATAESFCRAPFVDDAPEPVRLAVLLHAGHFYTNRENGNVEAYRTMMQAFHSLLWPYRDPDKLI